MRHQIRGRVVDEFTGDGIGGVRVEAWDKDFGLDDFLGSASTRSDGSFSIVFDESAFSDLFFDRSPDIYFKVFRAGELLESTENSVLWNVRKPEIGVEIRSPHPKPPDCDERHIYLKIERIENYSPVKPQDKAVPPMRYGRDCMRNHGHESGLIPQAEIDRSRTN
jgi:hypothetical protein